MKLRYLRSMLILTAILLFASIIGPMKALSLSNGTVAVQFTPVTYWGEYAPDHIVAVWVENSDGDFIRTLSIWSQEKYEHLIKWDNASNGNKVDAVTSATIKNHKTLNTEWDCTDLQGELVPDGTYKIIAEFTEDASEEGEKLGKFVEMSFVKGNQNDPNTYTKENFTGVSLDYTFLNEIISPPGITTLTSPASGSTLEPGTINLVWEENVDADTYDLIVLKNGSGDIEENVSTTSYDLSAPVSNTNYSWKVRGVNTGGNGDWSQEFSFLVKSSIPDMVTLSEPVDNAEDVEPTTLFKWLAVNDADQYEIEFTETETSETSSQTTDQIQILAADLKTGTEYTWRVRASAEGITGPWSPVRTFTTKALVLAAPNLLEPAADAIDVELDIMAKWSAVETAEEYQIQLTKTSDGSEISAESGQNQMSFSGKIESAEEYTWKVRAVAGGIIGAWSSHQMFTTKNTGLAAANLTEPADMATNLYLNVVFKWSLVENADKYMLTLTKTSDMSEMTFETTELQLTLEDNLENGEEYTWKIVPFAGTEAGPSSEVRTFYTILSTPSSVFPENGAKDLESDITLKWLAVSNAENYHLIVTEKVSGTVFVDNNEIPQATTDFIEFDLKGLASLTEYSWKVRALNTSGEGNWTDGMTFTIGDLSSVEDEITTIALVKASPNPFNAQTSIQFNLMEAANLTIDIYDINGNLIDNVFSGYAEIGLRSYTWNASGLSNSVYYYHIKINNKAIIGKLILIK